MASVALVGFAFFRPVFEDGALRLLPRFDLARWARTLPDHARWVVPFVVLTASLPATRALVWRHTLPGAPPPFRRRLHALALGGLVHNVLPGRLGPLATAWILSQRHAEALPALFSSLLLAKLVELGALLGTTAVLAALARGLGLAGAPPRGVLVLGGGLFVIFAVLLATARRIAPWAADRLHRRGRWPRVAGVIEALGAGLAAVGTPKRLGLALLLALLPVTTAVVAHALALDSMGVAAPLLGGGLLVGAITLGQLTPGLPIGVGVYYFVCTSTARALGASAEDAAALAVLSHAFTFLTHLLVGVVAALANRPLLRRLVRLRRPIRT
jgi:uncharacterized membrane protein YbhN (UPF0104 family)